MSRAFQFSQMLGIDFILNFAHRSTVKYLMKTHHKNAD